MQLQTRGQTRATGSDDVDDLGIRFWRADVRKRLLSCSLQPGWVAPSQEGNKGRWTIVVKGARTQQTHTHTHDAGFPCSLPVILPSSNHERRECLGRFLPSEKGPCRLLSLSEGRWVIIFTRTANILQQLAPFSTICCILDIFLQERFTD